MPAKFLRAARDRFLALRSRTDGATAIVFAIVLVPVVMLIGLLLDYGRYAVAKGQLDAITDSVALLSANVTNPTLNALNPARQRSARIDAGQSLFDARAATVSDTTITGRSVEVTVANFDVTVKASYEASIPLVFGGLFGASTWSFQGSSAAVAKLAAYTDVYLLIDSSASMAIGSTQADIDRLIKGTGCAFACHDNSKSFWTAGGMVDSYGWAVANKVSLRFQVINKGIGAFVDHVQSNPANASTVRVALYSFDNDLNEIVPVTGDVARIKQKYPSTPSAASEYGAATHFNEIIDAFLLKVGSGGDGTSQAAARKLVIIATDGVQDPNRSWTWNLPLRAQVDAVSTAFCGTAARKKIAVGIIHTPYLPMPWDWGYMATLGQPSQSGGAKTRADDIEPRLKDCAGQYYVNSSDPEVIASAFTSIFEKYSSPRLSQ